MMDLQETLKDIKTQFRMGMNGVTSKSMRDKGLDYKLNFGVEVPRLKEIAARYAKDHQLAQALWKENIRESKILAAMLQPVDTFYPEIAEIWVEDMHYPELAELTCQHLFQYLPYASEKAFEWIADEREYFAACGSSVRHTFRPPVCLRFAAEIRTARAGCRQKGPGSPGTPARVSR